MKKESLAKQAVQRKPLGIKIFVRICVFLMAFSLIGVYVVYMFAPAQNEEELNEISNDNIINIDNETSEDERIVTDETVTSNETISSEDNEQSEELMIENENTEEIE